MRDLIFRFLQLEVINYHPIIPWGILIVYGFVLVSALSSLRSLLISRRSFWGWGILIVCVPFLGVAAYSIRCLFRSDWSFLKPLTQSRSEAVRAATNPKKFSRT